VILVDGNGDAGPRRRKTAEAARASAVIGHDLVEGPVAPPQRRKAPHMSDLLSP
jgi:hypothetical protein